MMRIRFSLVIFAGFAALCSGFQIKTEAEPDDRLNCVAGVPDGDQPPNRVDTEERVQNLIDELSKLNDIDGQDPATLDAYIVPTEDAHQSEYVADPDQRRQYISGFSGSAGVAVILTSGGRALWTDGRYFLQADQELDCNWLLMRERQENTPSLTTWIKENLPQGGKVGADPSLFGLSVWERYERELQDTGENPAIELVLVRDNLVDKVWLDRPSYPLTEAFIHPIEYAGEDWTAKVGRVRAAMTAAATDAFVVTALDETAWLLNIRAADIPYNPVLISYVVVTETEVHLFADKNKITTEVKAHLNIDQTPCSTVCVVLHDPADQSTDGSGNHDDVFYFIEKQVPGWEKVWLPEGLMDATSVALAYQVPVEKRVLATSPVLEMKAQKNAVEIEGMRQSHIRDAVGLIRFLHYLEEEVKAGHDVTDFSVVDTITDFRKEQDDFKELSFESISSFGPNGAIIHHSPSKDTEIKIDDSNLYLIDSGAQYLDGTTDVTRTVHFGTPTAEQIEMYTRVLIGNIDFGTIVFPHGTTSGDIDILARSPLYHVGLDYRHGTGHGVGMFLNVHETNRPAYELGYFTSNEPGYYKDGEYGIRLENVMFAVDTGMTFDTPFYTFETVTLVPFEPKLIDTKMLNKKQCDFLNEYNSEIRTKVGPLLSSYPEADAWMLSKTAPMACPEFDTEPTKTQEVPTTTIEVSTHAPDVPTNTPDVPTNTPDVPTNTPDVPTNTPDVPTNTPDVPTNTPDVPTNTPDVPTNTPEISTNTPDTPTIPTTTTEGNATSLLPSMLLILFMAFIRLL